MSVRGKENVLAYAQKKREICQEVKQIIVDQLCLDMDPAFITSDQPLFGRGLELDSIDSLELSVGVFNKYQISLSDDEKDIFSSVNALVDYIMKNMNNADAAPSETVELSGGIEL